jgi:hypothetical protein
MQAIKLFSQYDPEALFLKVRKDVADHVGQWPEEYLSSEQIGFHVGALQERDRLSLPDIDFANGREVLVERIYPLSVYQPGLKPDVKVRVNVLIYKYPFKGRMYLLGCRPPVAVPKPVGQWFADSINQEISIEYPEYEKYPKKTIVAHQRYAVTLQPCYESLKQEIAKFNVALDGMIQDAVNQRQKDVEDLKQMLSRLK